MALDPSLRAALQHRLAAWPVLGHDPTKAQRRAAVVIVTSDKCYENPGSPAPFAEDAILGGSDPYGSSKACAASRTATPARRSTGAGSGLRANRI